MKKILITGALGFIGRTLLETLIYQHPEMEIFGIDIKEAPLEFLEQNKSVHIETIDIRNKKAVKEFICDNRFDGIIHLAAISRVIDAEFNKSNCIETNYLGTKNIVEAIADKQESWFIFGSSREVYGEQISMPVSEDAELLPLNIYGFYKLESERFIRNNIKRHCILRFSNVYGNKYDIPGRVIPHFVQTAIDGGEIVLEGGQQMIDFTHISDTVYSIIRCMEFFEIGRISQETIHISPGIENKITDIIDILYGCGYEFAVKKRESRSYDVQRFVGNPAKRIKIIGNHQFLDLRQGIHELLKQYDVLD